MRAPRPYAVSSREFGRGKAERKTFTTLDAASTYIQSVWEGTDYIDGPDGFHTDYCTFTLTGFVLRDIGHYVFHRDIHENYREFHFGPAPVASTPPTPPPPPVVDEDIDALPF